MLHFTPNWWFYVVGVWSFGVKFSVSSMLFIWEVSALTVKLIKDDNWVSYLNVKMSLCMINGSKCNQSEMRSNETGHELFPATHTHTQNHTPKCLPVHIFLCDSDISKRFIPHWIERVTDCLRFQFIGLKETQTDIVTNINFGSTFDTAASRSTVV